LPRSALALVAVLSFATLSFMVSARADDFPKHPITMIVPFAAGGTSDVIARTVAWRRQLVTRDARNIATCSTRRSRRTLHVVMMVSPNVTTTQS
jgi:hypothetical protein